MDSSLKMKSSSLYEPLCKQLTRIKSLPPKEERLKQLYIELFQPEALHSITKKKDLDILYDSFAKIVPKTAQFLKKTPINDFINQYKKTLSLNKHSKFFSTEKCSNECMKLPEIIENPYVQEELEKLEGYSKGEKSLFYLLSILPRTKFYPNLYEIPVEIHDNSLLFDSRFESGNLRRVLQVGENEYNLILDFDCTTSNYSQWYFFKVFNIHKERKVKFNIINLVKSNSFYNAGQQPRVFSERAFELSKEKWHYDCSEVSYVQSEGLNVKAHKTSKKKKLKVYTLSFTYEFRHEVDQVYFAHCFPYTYSDLAFYVKTMEKKESLRKMLRVERLGRTVIGNELFCFIVTNDIGHKFPFYVNNSTKKKKLIFLTARVHPGESNSSFIIKGLLDFLLTTDNPGVHSLRNDFLFVVIPMLNPDGVKYGNYRCNLYGYDLNRQWQNPHKILQCPIFLAKSYLKNLRNHFEIELICDFHGHSKSQDVFLYGCNYNEEGGEASAEKNSSIRRFPFILSKLKEYFSYEKSSFSLSKYKYGTARIALFKELCIDKSYTLEASLYGFQNRHFSINDYEEIGKTFGQGLCLLFYEDGLNARIVKLLSSSFQREKKKPREGSESETFEDKIAHDIKELSSGFPSLASKTEGQENNNGIESMIKMNSERNLIRMVTRKDSHPKAVIVKTNLPRIQDKKMPSQESLGAFALKESGSQDVLQSLHELLTSKLENVARVGFRSTFKRRSYGRKEKFKIQSIVHEKKEGESKENSIVRKMI